MAIDVSIPPSVATQSYPTTQLEHHVITGSIGDNIWFFNKFIKSDFNLEIKFWICRVEVSEIRFDLNSHSPKTEFLSFTPFLKGNLRVVPENTYKWF